MIAQTNQAVVQDVTVTVKNVLIGKRQLTQRVFKQIQEEDLINLKTGELEGTPIGFVNYSVDKTTINNKDTKQFLWITKDQQLRRCIIKISDYRYIYNMFKDGLVLSNILCSVGFYKSQKKAQIIFKEYVKIFWNKENQLMNIDVPKKIFSEFCSDEEYLLYSFQNGKLVHGLGNFHPCSEEILDEVNHLISQIQPTFEKWFENFKKIPDYLNYLWTLEQLYIAL